MSKSTRTIFVIFLAVAAGGCIKRATHAAKVRAAADFACPEHQVHIEKAGDLRYHATGCGSEATYVCLQQPTHYLPSSGPNGSYGRGVWISNTECVREGDVASTSPEPTRKVGQPPQWPPPTGAAGFSLGSPPRDAESACTASGHAWASLDGVFSCSGTPVSVGFPASIELRFCDGGLCRIDVIDRPEGLDSDGWIDRFSRLKRQLEGRYGPQHDSRHELPGGCATNLLPCMNEGRAAAWSTWRWPDGHTLTLGMGKLEESAAIRLSYTLDSKASPGL